MDTNILFTDIVGLLFLIPPIRYLFLRKYTYFFSGKARATRKGKTIIDVDHRSEDE